MAVSQTIAVVIPAGLAALLELHYTTTLQDADTISISQRNLNSLTLTSSDGNVDVLNLTAGLHAQFSSRWNIRVAATAPLRRNEDDRLFSSEIQVSANKEF